MDPHLSPGLCTYISGQNCKEGCYPNNLDVNCACRKKNRKRKLLLLKIIELILLTICVIATIAGIFSFDASFGVGSASLAFILSLVNLIALIAVMLFLHNSTRYVVEMHDLIVTLQLLVTIFISALICAISAVINVGLAIAAFFAFVLVLVLIVDVIKQIKRWPVTVTRLDPW